MLEHRIKNHEQEKLKVNVSFFLFWGLVFILTSCHSQETKDLSNVICDCFESKRSDFELGDEVAKKVIVGECLKEKIEAKAKEKNEIHLKNSDRSKMLDFMFELSRNTSKYLNHNCDFFSEKKEEIELLMRPEDGDF